MSGELNAAACSKGGVETHEFGLCEGSSSREQIEYRGRSELRVSWMGLELVPWLCMMEA
jgi:hypothetical protein